METNLLSKPVAAVRWFGLLAVALVMLPMLGHADATIPQPVANPGHTAWMLTATVLVLFMTIPGLALFYGGLVRKKNIVNTLMQCFAICCLVSVLWFVVGYSIAFTPGSTPFFGGLDGLMMANVQVNSVTGEIPTTVFAMFQMTFAIITPALIIGSFVERMKFGGMLMFMGLWLLLVYCPMAYMVWNGGYLAQMGVLDFAGGNVVHLNAGIAGLVACVMLGKRHQLGVNEDQFKPSNIAYTMMGASMLWVGWFGFNAGSALMANGAAGIAMLNTHLAAAAAGLAWMVTEWIIRGKPTLVGLSCGVVAGLVAVTPGAGFVDPAGAMIMGMVSGVLCLLGGEAMKRKLGYDDSLDVVGVHGIGGLIGAVLTGVLAVSAVGGKSGWVEGNFDQVVTQLMGCAVTIGWAGLMTLVILLLTQATVGLRVTTKDEDTGLDMSLHGEKAST